MCLIWVSFTIGNRPTYKTKNGMLRKLSFIKYLKTRLFSDILFVIPIRIHISYIQYWMLWQTFQKSIKNYAFLDRTIEIQKPF